MSGAPLRKGDDYARRPPYRVLKPGGGSTCPDRNEIWQFTILGSPTGGSYTATFSLRDTADTITLNFDDSAAAIQTAFEGHAGAEVGDEFDVTTGGSLPNATVQIEFKGDLKATAIALPTFNWGSLTGGTGVGVFYSRPQNGHPG